MRLLTLFVSALALAILIPSLSYAADPKAKEPFPTVGPPSCNAPGRYVLVQHSSVRADQFLLDTCLGRIWQKVSYTDIGADIWQVIPRADSEDELFQWQLEQLSKSSKENK
ncbi:hypothetical protein [Sideroxyarcus sp. TK5]